MAPGHRLAGWTCEAVVRSGGCRAEQEGKEEEGEIHKSAASETTSHLHLFPP